MSLSGSVTTTSHSNRSVTLSWSASQSVADNQSTLTWSLTGSGSYTGWVEVSEIRITIDGQQVYYRNSDNHTRCYQGTELCNGTTTITHNEDGTKSFSVKVEAGIYMWAINCSGESSFTLDTIARASSISAASNITLGNSCSVSWIPSSALFRYKLKFVLGSWNYTTGYIYPNSTSYFTYADYTIPVDVSAELPNATTGTMTVYLYSYNGSSQIGSTASRTFTVTVPSSVKPTVTSVTATLVNSNTVINSWGIAVAGYTRVRVTATASGAQNSTIKSFTLSGAYNQTMDGATFSYTGSAITSSGSKTFTVKAKDSRGRVSSSQSASSITFYAYSNPRVTSFTATRDSANSQNIVVKGNWSYSSVNSRNSATAKLYYKRQNDSSWTLYGDITSSKNTNLTLSGATFDNTYSYNFKLEVTDSIGNSSLEESFVPTISVLLDFRAGGNGLGIGKIAESDSLEIALETVFMDDVYIMVGSTKVSLADYIRGVINNTYS